MEVPNLAIGQILSSICRRIKLTAGGTRDPLLAGAVANYAALPADMLHDILLRLPADEVCRLRLVCRRWRTLTFDPHFAWAHASHYLQPHVIVVRHEDDAAEVRDVDLHGNVMKCRRIRRPIGPLSVHGDLLCASHGWDLTCVVDMVTGAVVDVAADPWKKVNSARPHCVLGHVPSTNEYKVLRIQADYRCRRWRQRCEVMTMGGGYDARRRWRQRKCPPATLRLEQYWPGSWNVAIVNGLAYFLVDDLSMEADCLAVFDLAIEEWKPLTLQGPITTNLLASANGTWRRPLCQTHFQLAKLGERLVVLYCNVKKGWTELWFLEDMEDDMTAHWSRWYTLQRTVHDDTRSRTPYADDEAPLFHYPLAVLDDGRILVWLNSTSALRIYDRETCTWMDFAMLTGDCVVGMHHGSLLCSNVGVVQP